MIKDVLKHLAHPQKDVKKGAYRDKLGQYADD
jgi:hypothetical protein